MTGPRQTPSRRAGFTLIEAIIVLAVMLIAMTFGFPALQNMIQRSRTEAFVREGAILMRYARSEAIRNGGSISVVLDTTSGQERIFAFRDTDADGTVDPGEEELRGRGFDLPKGVVFGTPADPPIEDFPNDAATFRSDGSIRLDDSFGRLTFSDRRENRLRINVGPAASGRIEVEQWDGSSWTSHLKHWK